MDILYVHRAFKNSVRYIDIYYLEMCVGSIYIYGIYIYS